MSASDRSICYAIGVRSVAFPANGNCLLAAVQDGLKVWAWEPVRRLDTVDVPWAKVTVSSHSSCLYTINLSCSLATATHGSVTSMFACASGVGNHWGAAQRQSDMELHDPEVEN